MVYFVYILVVGVLQRLCPLTALLSEAVIGKGYMGLSYMGLNIFKEIVKMSLELLGLLLELLLLLLHVFITEF